MDRKPYDTECELSRYVHRRAALADERLCGYSRWRFGRVVSGGFRLVGRIITHLGEPFRHLAALRRGSKQQTARSVLLGIVIAVPLLWIVVSLLASADAAFGALIERIFGVWSVSKTVRTVIRAVFYTLIPALVFCSALAAADRAQRLSGKGKTPCERPRRHNVHRRAGRRLRRVLRHPDRRAVRRGRFRAAGGHDVCRVRPRGLFPAAARKRHQRRPHHHGAAPVRIEQSAAGAARISHRVYVSHGGIERNAHDALCKRLRPHLSPAAGAVVSFAARADPRRGSIYGVPREFPAVPLYAHCVHGALARVRLRAAGRDRGAV